MTAYTTISNALVAVGAKPFATTVQALRDNPTAIAEGDSAAPVNAYGWHPYNKVTVGDINTGKFYDFVTDGALAAITTPDFEDGYEYAVLIDQVRSTTNADLRINLWRETTGAYGGVLVIPGIGPVGSAASGSGWIELPRTRRTFRHHFALSTSRQDGGSVAVSITPLNFSIWTHATAEKILRAQFSASVGNLTGSGSTGQMYLYRRKDIGA